MAKSVSKLHIKVVDFPDNHWLRGCKFITIEYKWNYASDDLEHLYKHCMKKRFTMGWS
jgi:hypothetical protein